MANGAAIGGATLLPSSPAVSRSDRPASAECQDINLCSSSGMLQSSRGTGSVSLFMNVACIKTDIYKDAGSYHT